MTELTLMAVHAHPDDEASGTGGILAKYSAEGIRTVLVTCTNGDYGDGPGHVKPGEKGHDPASVAATRKLELAKSVEALGVRHLEMLGYHDSGMMQWDFKDQGHTFWNVPIEEPVAKLVALMEHYRPQVVVTYDERGGYGHPDHIRAHEIAVAATQQTGIPAKLYYTGRGRQRNTRIRELMAERGIEMAPPPAPRTPAQPVDPEVQRERERRMAEAEARITTTIDVSAVGARKHASLAAHQSQLDMSFWMRIPEDLAGVAFAEERFIRVQDSTGAPLPEDDLFAGLR